MYSGGKKTLLLKTPFMLSSGSLNIIQFGDFAKMMAVNRKRDGQCEQLRAARKGPEQQLPILEALFAKNAQADTRTEDRQRALKIQRGPDLRPLILPEKNHGPSIAVFWRVNLLQDVPVSLPQRIKTHYRNGVGSSIYVVAGNKFVQASLLSRGLIKSCAGKSVQ
jgi:hypothetical protein